MSEVFNDEIIQAHFNTWHTKKDRNIKELDSFIEAARFQWQLDRKEYDHLRKELSDAKGEIERIEEIIADGVNQSLDDKLTIAIEALEMIAEAKEFTLRCHYCEAQEVAQQALAKLSAGNKVAEIEGE